MQAFSNRHITASSVDEGLDRKYHEQQTDEGHRDLGDNGSVVGQFAHLREQSPGTREKTQKSHDDRRVHEMLSQSFLHPRKNSK